MLHCDRHVDVLAFGRAYCLRSTALQCALGK